MKRRVIYKVIFKPVLFFYLLFSGTVPKAQEEFIEPPARYLTTVPFVQLTGGVVLMQARFGNFPDTLNFILDTGSSGISLDSSTALYLNLNPVPTDKTIRGIAGIKKVSFLYNQQLRFPGLTVDSLNFHVNDYSILSAVYGLPIDGIIGYSLLSRYILFINYDSSKIHFFSNGTIRYPKGGYLLKPQMGTMPLYTLRVKDARTITARFLYDMGAGLCMMLTKDFIEDSSLLHKKRKLWPKEAEGLGGKVDMELTVIREVKLGPYRFRNVPVFVFDDEYNVTSYPYLGGLVGNEILRRFNVILNYDKKDIYLMPNSHYHEAFDYSYPGMELYFINNEIIVGNVAKNSPADKAGVQEGDVVIAINKNFSKNLNQYKLALQSANSMVQLILKRGKEIHEIKFRIDSIF